MGMHTRSTRPQYQRRAQIEKGVVLLGLLGELVLATEVLAEADFEEGEGTILAVEGGGDRGGVDWHSLGVRR